MDTGQELHLRHQSNPIESQNVRYRRSVRVRGPPSQLAGRPEMPLSDHPLPGPDRPGQGRPHGRTALNAFVITFEGRIRTP
jgi:hypothetical protein